MSYEGIHNENLEKTIDRLVQGNTYKDVSTVIVKVSRGTVAMKVVDCWLGLMMPMNQKITRLTIIKDEVGVAYNNAIEMILAEPNLSKWKYILTLEEDNTPPPDGLLKLYESIGDFGAISGIYFTKGEGGMPMIYGNPLEFPINFIPQNPIPNSIQQCNGLGMGFTLFKIDMFKDPRIPRPFFKTIQEYIEGQGARLYTQDLYFFENAGKCGYKFAVDTRVKVGHYDLESDKIW